MARLSSAPTGAPSCMYWEAHSQATLFASICFLSSLSTVLRWWISWKHLYIPVSNIADIQFGSIVQQFYIIPLLPFHIPLQRCKNQISIQFVNVPKAIAECTFCIICLNLDTGGCLGRTLQVWQQELITSFTNKSPICPNNSDRRGSFFLWS